jgi:hypothetical protein
MSDNDGREHSKSKSESHSLRDACSGAMLNTFWGRKSWDVLYQTFCEPGWNQVQNWHDHVL